MTWLRKWWLWAGLILLIVAGVFGYKSWAGKNAVPEYRTAKIERGEITATVSASGTLSPVVSVQVGSQVSGQIKEIYVDFNSEVKKDQLIARIDPETFEYRVRQSQADLDAARSQVATQQANIAAQRAQLSQVEVTIADARRDLERKQQLVEKGFISGAERDKAQATYNALVEQGKAAQAQVQVAIANAGNAQAGVKQREAALAQAKIDLERTAIKAPVNGVVIKRSVEKGQTVAASLQAPELFIIAENLADMRVDTSIDESEIGRIRTGQKATFTVDAFPGRTFEGGVKQIRQAAQTVSNVVTYLAEISAPNPNKILLPGMTANVRIVTDSRNDVLKAPNSALRFKPPGAVQQATSAGSAIAGNAPAASQTNHPGPQYLAQRERMEKELQLSADQKAKLDGIYAGLREKMTAMRDAAPEERQKIGERNRAELRAQINEMLTPEQRKKYELLLAEEGERRGGMGNQRGRIFILDQQNRPKEISVRLGLTDGVMTEISGPEVREGMSVVTGTVQTGQPGQTRSAPPRGPRMF